jgi:hypothetical protein
MSCSAGDDSSRDEGMDEWNVMVGVFTANGVFLLEC